MKKIFTLLSLVFIAISVFAQAPEGIIYQAEARDNSGRIIENESLDVKITILENDIVGAVIWEGLHNVTTNKYGMFVLVIGTGTNTYGYNFEEINWGSNSHFLNVQVKTSRAFDWVDMGTTQFLSVPYALHAKTADALVFDSSSHLKSAGPGVPSQTWSLFGNSKSNPDKDKFGTTDSTDLVFVTDNIERLRITSDGRIITGPGKFTMGGNLEVQGDSTRINKDLYVGRNVVLNFDDGNNPRGETFNGGNFTVENKSSTLLTGTLNVDSITTITDTTQSTAIDNGALIVNGGTGIARNLNVGEEFRVHGQSQFDTDINVDGLTMTDKLVVDTTSNPDPAPRFGSIADVRGIFVADSIILSGGLVVGGNLKVNGDSVIISNDLYVHGTTNLKDDLNLTKNDTGFVATFFNTNDGTGDGIQIKLGKLATKHDPAAEAAETAAKGYLGENFSDYENLRNLVQGKIESLSGDWLVNLAIPTDPEEAKRLTYRIAGSMCSLTNSLKEAIITQLDGAVEAAVNEAASAVVIPMNTIFATLDPLFCWLPAPVPACGEVFPPLEIPWIYLPPIPLPPIPDIPCGDLGLTDTLPLPNIDMDWPATLTEPRLDKANTFIEFADSSGWKMGAISAQSIEDWAKGYLDPVFLYNLYATFRVLDKAGIYAELEKQSKEIAKAYVAIGVSYGSGNGDYAEWLERLDHSEFINAGDIVGVKGGKISKDLTDAEQIMAVSEKPIVLGNIPEEGKSHLGNNVAFMGQIPVKIMGPVATGDYIVGTSDIPGYGVAIHPENMTIEDFKFAVGRSWDANTDDGPKMVNTVVGVHNGDYLNILKRYEQKFRESEARLESVEAKIDALSTLLPQAQNSK